MKKMLIVVVAFVMSSSPAFATFYDGIMLAQKWREYKNHENGLKMEINADMDASWYQGYVTGIADACDGVMFSIPVGVMPKQIYEIVGKYLDDHHGELNKPADVLVEKAIMSAFPTKTDQGKQGG